VAERAARSQTETSELSARLLVLLGRAPPDSVEAAASSAVRSLARVVVVAVAVVHSVAVLVLHSAVAVVLPLAEELVLHRRGRTYEAVREASEEEEADSWRRKKVLGLRVQVSSTLSRSLGLGRGSEIACCEAVAQREEEEEEAGESASREQAKEVSQNTMVECIPVLHAARHQASSHTTTLPRSHSSGAHSGSREQRPL
jgi:hypothetical protein